MASAAAALERPVTLFATLAATRAFLAAGPDGRPGWAGLPLSPDLAEPGPGRRRGARCALPRAGASPASRSCCRPAPASASSSSPARWVCARSGVAAADAAAGPADPARRARDPARPRGPGGRALSRRLPPDLHISTYAGSPCAEGAAELGEVRFGAGGNPARSRLQSGEAAGGRSRCRLRSERWWSEDACLTSSLTVTVLPRTSPT